MPEDRFENKARLLLLFGLSQGFKNARPDELTQLVRKRIEGLDYKSEALDTAFKRHNKAARRQLARTLLKFPGRRFATGPPTICRRSDRPAS